ncbi:MAG: Asp-tRNA(Asn)/Glu-tRNA(Gln) amidotransferase subunit GatB [Legionellales bacterium]|nr:Asp-tRNA(Asn)/Glu-tRNA(Gln) amidotransferase subunit GatB [Legionellales bacterium]
MQWEPVIGLEVHTQLKTKSKIFSGAPTEYGGMPNTQACIIDLGMPGVLPVLNNKVIEMAIQFGLAISATINDRSVFARKNYFYPDLPKGYQISQHDIPIVSKGQIEIKFDDTTKVIGITRAHLEEDAGKSIHDLYDEYSAIDLNRAGTPLLEIVSEPDIRSSREAIAYLKKLYSIVTYLGICDGNLQEGSFRVDANVSVRPLGETKFGTRTEIKNINSFKFVEQAIIHEIQRQIKILENNGKIIQETRLYDSVKNETKSMRSKEEAHDYRYFPDPDLLPIEITKDMLQKCRESLPELPHDKSIRFINEYKLSDYNANILITEKALADYFENVNKLTTAQPKTVANWIITEVLSHLKKNSLNITSIPVTSEMLANLINKIEDRTINGKIAKTVFEEMWKNGKSAEEIIEEKNLTQVNDDGQLLEIIRNTLAKHKEKVEDYKNGKDKLFGFFVGQVMKESHGKANPAQVNSLLQKTLKEE